MSELKEELRPLQPTRGRSIQGVRGRLEQALNRPQCLVFGLPPFRPDPASNEWGDRKYSLGFTGAAGVPLEISTLSAPQRQPFKRVSIALDILPIYRNPEYGVNESFEETKEKSVVGEVEFKITLTQDGVNVGSVTDKVESFFVFSNYLSESHSLRTLGLQYINATRYNGDLGIGFAYHEGTFDPIDGSSQRLSIRQSVELDGIYSPHIPIRIDVTVATENTLMPADDSNQNPESPPHIAFVDLWATSFSAWGHYND